MTAGEIYSLIIEKISDIMACQTDILTYLVGWSKYMSEPLLINEIYSLRQECPPIFVSLFSDLSLFQLPSLPFLSLLFHSLSFLFSVVRIVLLCSSVLHVWRQHSNVKLHR